MLDLTAQTGAAATAEADFRVVSYRLAVKNGTLESLYNAYRQCKLERQRPEDYGPHVTMDELTDYGRAYRLKQSQELLDFIIKRQNGRTTIENLDRLTDWLEEFGIQLAEVGLDRQQMWQLRAQTYHRKP